MENINKIQSTYLSFIKDIHNEYLNLQDLNLLYIQRLKNLTSLCKIELLNNLEYFEKLNNFLSYEENKLDKTQNLKLDNNEIEDYYNFYNVIMECPYYEEIIEDDKVNNLLNDNKFNKILDNKTILINNNIFKMKYCYYIKNIIINLLQTKKYTIEQINIHNNNLNNYYNINNDMIQILKTNILCYNSLLNECNNLISSLYYLLDTIFTKIKFI